MKAIRFHDMSCEERQAFCARPFPMFDKLPVKVRRAINETRHGASLSDLDHYLTLHLAGESTSSIVALVRQDDQKRAQDAYRRGILKPEFAGDEYTEKGRSSRR